MDDHHYVCCDVTSGDVLDHVLVLSALDQTGFKMQLLVLKARDEGCTRLRLHSLHRLEKLHDAHARILEDDERQLLHQLAHGLLVHQAFQSLCSLISNTTIRKRNKRSEIAICIARKHSTIAISLAAHLVVVHLLQSAASVASCGTHWITHHCIEEVLARRVLIVGHMDVTRLVHHLILVA